jgi:hypothetical protein
MKIIGYILFFLVFCCCRSFAADDNEEARARQFVEKYDKEAVEVSYESALKSWIYNTNITDYNSEQMVSFIFSLHRSKCYFPQR